jgi:hypothetical protein
LGYELFIAKLPARTTIGILIVRMPGAFSADWQGLVNDEGNITEVKARSSGYSLNKSIGHCLLLTPGGYI